MPPLFRLFFVTYDFRLEHIWSTSGQVSVSRLPFFTENQWKSDEWNGARIEVFEERHMHDLNGQLVSILHDFHPQRRSAGHVALQLHSGPNQHVEFRDVYISTCE
mgnify:CR=1 FL=1